MKNVLFISTILLSLVNIGFFIYGFHEVSVLSNTVKGECRQYFKYNIGVLSSFALSIFVLISYICCSNFISNILYTLNAIGLCSLAIHRYVKTDVLCDYKCEMKCGDLVKLGNNVEAFFIADLSIIALTVLYLLFLFFRKLFSCCDE